jgi:glycosyltransferase involved in cell wall biosynthesis
MKDFRQKITFVYAYENEKWSTPMALANQFKKIGWEVEFVSIGSNRTGQYHDRDLQLWIQQDTPSNIVLFMDWGRFDSKWLDKALKPNTYWIQESGDDPQNFERNYPKSERFHLTLSPDSESAIEYRKRNQDAHWWTHFADTVVQYPMDIKEEYVVVTTRGVGSSDFLDTLTSHGNGTVGNQNGFEALEHTEFLNKGTMVVQNSRWGEVTRRIFEGMACGKMVLCDRLHDNKKLHELFTDGEDIVFYDDIIDCINKMNKYTDDDKERERIAKNGYDKVMANHTQVQRVELILNKYREWKSE